MLNFEFIPRFVFCSPLVIKTLSAAYLAFTVNTIDNFFYVRRKRVAYFDELFLLVKWRSKFCGLTSIL